MYVQRTYICIGSTLLLLVIITRECLHACNYCGASLPYKHYLKFIEKPMEFNRTYGIYYIYQIISKHVHKINTQYYN